MIFIVLVAFSCETRYFCPNCHQKRVLLYGGWVEEPVLAPVPHRQYVFTVPRLLADAYAATLPGGKPGLILLVQTFGDLVNFNPHVPVLAADGAFLSVIRRILEHLGLWAPRTMRRSPLLGPEAWPMRASLPLIYHPDPASPGRRTAPRAPLTWRARGLHDLPQRSLRSARAARSGRWNTRGPPRSRAPSIDPASLQRCIVTGRRRRAYGFSCFCYERVL